jgi:hypothetical protein
LVWAKQRDASFNHILTDTERGVSKFLYSDQSNAEETYSGYGVTAFNSDGFAVTDPDFYGVNKSGADYASWTFRKAEKFFDVVTYTGTGTEQQIPHNLTSAAKFYVVKRTDAAGDWYVATPGLADWNNSYLVLNSTAAKVSLGDAWSTTSGAPYTTFGVMDGSTNNISGATYVAYLFASDAGGFGDDGDESIIKCGSYVGNSAGVEVNLGFEPQWVLVKPSSTTGNWDMADVMRGATAEKTATFDGNWAELTANTSAAEIARDATITPRATGMFIKDNGLSNNGETYIYIAIRRPMKTPESGTEVFDVQQSITTDPNFVTGFNPDMTFSVPSTTASFRYIFSRLTGTGFMETSNTNAESTGGAIKWDYSGGAHNGFTSYYGWNFCRATGFFDVVAYTGNESTRTINHNLGVAPEMMIIKARESLFPYEAGWVVYHSAISPADSIYLSQNGSSSGASFQFASTEPTSSVFTLGSAIDVNMSGKDFISYHFATLAGVSKVGSYTGTGADLNVDCGFSAGARFILIKRTDSTGDWYVWDSERGIVAGNDPYLLLNSTAAEVTSTDYIDPLSSGFTVTSSAPAALNASGGTYIFLAIA